MPAKRKKQSFSVRIDAALIAQLRSFVKDHAGKPLYLEMGSFVEGAITQHLALIEREIDSLERDKSNQVRPKGIRTIDLSNSRGSR
jgi:hypothetical protein